MDSFEHWVGLILNKETFAMAVAAWLIFKTSKNMDMLTKALEGLSAELKAHRAESDQFCQTLTSFVNQIVQIMLELNLTTKNHTALLSELELRKQDKQRVEVK